MLTEQTTMPIEETPVQGALNIFINDTHMRFCAYVCILFRKTIK